MDFFKPIKNSDKFRQAAIHFEKHNTYDKYPVGSKEYTAHWEEEANRSLHGFKAEDGDYISGYNYFFLNYMPMLKLVLVPVINRDTGKLEMQPSKKVGFPRFFDYDKFFFDYQDAAERNDKFGVAVKCRRKGYSYKGGSMLLRNFFLIPDSKSFAVCSKKDFLIRDGILTKAWEGMDFINTHTPWKKSLLVDQSLHKTSGLRVKDKFGKWIKTGFKSEIMGIVIKDDPDKIRGISATLIIFDEGGSFPHLKETWTIADSSTRVANRLIGWMLALGTGAVDAEDTAGLKDLFFNLDAFNVHGIPNIWDEDATDTQCGFYCPMWANLEVADDKGTFMFMDKDGNTLHEKARSWLRVERQRIIDTAPTTTDVDAYMIENSCCPQESFLTLTGAIFPKRQTLDQIAKIKTNRALANFKQVGMLCATNGKITWQASKDNRGDIDHYPLNQGERKDGDMVIWEHPTTERPPFGKYVAALDSYDLDKAETSTSLGSLFIWKRHTPGEDFSNTLVAEYTARPDTSDEFYANCMNLLKYYNATALYENQNKGIYTYFYNHNCDYLLADQPDIISEILHSSRVSRKKGIHMPVQIKNTGLLWLKELLYKPDEENKCEIDRVLSVPLLQELASYNTNRNADRVSAMLILAIYLRQMENYTMNREHISDDERRRKLLTMPLFTDNAFTGAHDYAIMQEYGMHNNKFNFKF